VSRQKLQKNRLVRRRFDAEKCAQGIGTSQADIDIETLGYLRENGVSRMKAKSYETEPTGHLGLSSLKTVYLY
jgi:hypothetical protein